MTPQERVLFSRIHRRAADLSPEIARAVLRAFQNVRDSLTDAEIIRLVQLGGIERLYQQILSQAVLDVAFAPVRDVTRRAVISSVRYYAKDLPKAGKIDGVVSIGFDVLNPRMIDAVRALDTKVIAGLQQEVRDTVSAYVENGIRDGVGPRTIARSLRSSIGLGPSQLQEVQNYRDALLGQNGRRITDYVKRDKRFDTGKMTPERVDKAVAAYTKRRIALNAETTARTAALDAQKEAQRLSWEDAIAKGVVDRDRLRKRWVGVADDRERPEHRAMNGTVVPFDQPYPLPSGEMIPGSSTYNCRCISRVFVA
jgi:hypothetical protein